MGSPVSDLPPGFEIVPSAPSDLPPGFVLADPAPNAANNSPFARLITGEHGAPQDTAAADRAAFDAMPWYQKAGQAADDIVRLIANGASFGYADKLAAHMNGTDVASERALSQAAHNRAGSAGTAAELGGAVAVPVLAGSAGLSLPALTGASAMTGAGGLAARTGLMAAEGAGYGALGAAGNDQDVKKGAAIGALAGAGGNVLAEGASAIGSKIAGAFTPKPTIPTVDEARAAAGAAYKAAEDAGVIYTPQAVDNIRQRVVKELTDMGYDPALQPGAAVALRRIDDLAGKNVTLTGMESLRRVARNGYDVGGDSNDLAVRKIINAIDDTVANPASATVLTGDANQAAQTMATARDMWSRQAKADKIGDATSKAELRAASTGTGSNVDNATRQNLRGVYEREGGFTPDETSALLQAIRGTPGQNFLRGVGRLAPTSPFSAGMGASVGSGIGASLAGPPGAMVGAYVAPVVGQIAKSTADRMTANNVQQLIDIILAGGTRAAAYGAPNAAQLFMQGAREPASRALGAIGREEMR